MKKKIIKNAFKALVLGFLFLNLVSCGKGGNFRSAFSKREVSGGPPPTTPPPTTPPPTTPPPTTPPPTTPPPTTSPPTTPPPTTPPPTYTFSITQSAHEQKEVDIVMEIDNSGSMDDNHTNLGQRFGNLFNDNLQRVDWQMVFISTCFGDNAHEIIYNYSFETFYNLIGLNDTTHQILSPQLEDPGSIFLNTISSRQGGGCSTTEFQGILNMINAPETHPQGFFRPDALLAIVIVTDDTDTTTVRKSDIITAVENNFGQLKQFITYGLIVEPGDVECDLQEPNINYKVADLAEETGGFTGSICAEDYSSIMADIGTHIEKSLVYHEVMLRHTNVIEDSITLNCSLSGSSVECPNWEFDSESNKILFDTPPEENVKVEISYRYQP